MGVVVKFTFSRLLRVLPRESGWRVIWPCRLVMSVVVYLLALGPHSPLSHAWSLDHAFILEPGRLPPGRGIYLPSRVFICTGPESILEEHGSVVDANRETLGLSNTSSSSQRRSVIVGG